MEKEIGIFFAGFITGAIVWMITIPWYFLNIKPPQD